MEPAKGVECLAAEDVIETLARAKMEVPDTGKAAAVEAGEGVKNREVS